MRELNNNELACITGAYGNNIVVNIGEALVCSIGGAILGGWSIAILGGRGGSRKDLIGIGGGFTQLIGMLGGTVLGAIAGAVAGPFVGYKPGLIVAEDIINNLMEGRPGSLNKV